MGFYNFSLIFMLLASYSRIILPLCVQYFPFFSVDFKYPFLKLSQINYEDFLFIIKVKIWVVENSAKKLFVAIQKFCIDCSPKTVHHMFTRNLTRNSNKLNGVFLLYYSNQPGLQSAMEKSFIQIYKNGKILFILPPRKLLLIA